MTATPDRVALGVMVFAVMLAQVLLYPGVDTLVTALGAETTLDASTWFLAAEFTAFVLFAGLWGALSDRAGRRTPFIALGAVGGALGYAALGLAPTVTTLSFGAVLGLRALQGAATVGAFSLAMTMLMDLEGGHGRNMAAAGVAIGAGTAIGAPLGGQLYEFGALTPLWVASALLFGVGGLALFVADRSPDGRRDSLARVVASVRNTPTLGLPYAFGFLDRFTAGFFALVGTLYFRTVFELDPAATGLLLACFFAPFALLQYPFGVLSDRIGRTGPIVAGSAAYGVGVILVGQLPTPALAAVGMVAVGVLGALMAPATMALVTDLASASERGVAMAGFNAAGSLGFLGGVVVGGTVAGAYGYPAAFLVAGGLELALALATLPAFLRLDAARSATFAE